MARVSFFVWSMFLAAGLFLLYEVSYRVQSLEEDMARIDDQIVSERESMHVLRAEWTYLTRPERLQALIEKYDEGMAPMSSHHMVSLNDVPMHGVYPMPVLHKPTPPLMAAHTPDSSSHVPVAPAAPMPMQPRATESLWDVLELEEASVR